MSEPRPDRATLVAFGCVVLMGGSNVVAVRFSNRELEPFWGAGIRFAAASIVLLAVVVAMRLPIPRGRAFAAVGLYGLVAFAASFALFYWGAQEVPAGIAGTIMASTPLLAFFLAIAHRLERFRWRGLAGSLLALGGIAVIVAEPPGGALPLGSILAILGAAACAAESTIVVKLLPETHPVTTNAVGMAVGATALLALSALTGQEASLPTSGAVWTALLYLCFVGSPLLFILFVFVVRRWTASAASYQLVLFPPVSILLGALLADERVTITLLLGAPLVAAGVYVGALSGGRPKRRQDVDIGAGRSSVG